MPMVKIPTERLNVDKSLNPTFHLRDSDAAHLEKLSQEQQTVLKLRHQEKMSYEEMAAQTGWPINTIKTRIHRGRGRIHELRAEFALSEEAMQEPTMPAMGGARV